MFTKVLIVEHPGPQWTACSLYTSMRSRLFHPVWNISVLIANHMSLGSSHSPMNNC